MNYAIRDLTDYIHLVMAHSAGRAIHQVHPGGASLPEDADTGQ